MGDRRRAVAYQVLNAHAQGGQALRGRHVDEQQHVLLHQRLELAHEQFPALQRELPVHTPQGIPLRIGGDIGIGARVLIGAGGLQPIVIDAPFQRLEQDVFRGNAHGIRCFAQLPPQSEYAENILDIHVDQRAFVYAAKFAEEFPVYFYFFDRGNEALLQRPVAGMHIRNFYAHANNADR